MRTVKIAVTVDVVKELSQEEVKVTTRDFQTSVATLEKLKSIEKARKMLEDAISKKVSEKATELAGKKQEEMMGKVTGSGAPAQ